jgi:23S rRNA (cytidine1920-2'-O)/16S rRNA (cytidine1409-2'-O)-methyltransferase
VRDPAVQEAVVEDTVRTAAECGCGKINVFPSPIPGGDGNIEFFIGATLG